MVPTSITSSESVFATPRLTRRALMLGSVGVIASLSGVERLLSLAAARAAAVAAECDYVPWQIRLAFTGAALQREKPALEAAGYLPVSVSGYEADGGIRYTGLFVRRPPAAIQLTLGDSAAGFRGTYKQLTTYENYNLVAIDGFAVGDIARYSGIWERFGPERSFDIGLTAAALRDRLAEQAKASDYRPVDISGFEWRDRARFAVLWEQGSLPQWEARVDLTPEQFIDVNEQLRAAGYRLVDLSLYVVRGVARCAAIWNRDGTREEHLRVDDSRIDLDSQTEALRYRGYRPIAVDGHDAGGTDRYASVWSNHGIAQADERLMDEVITFFMKDHDIPGLSMAFAKDGRLVYARAFGVARKANAETGDSAEPLTVQHRFRIGSISKSITAIAIMKLAQEGKIESWNDKVFGDGALLGTRYGTPTSPGGTPDYPARVLNIQLRHLLYHTAGSGRIKVTDPDTENEKRDCVGGWTNAGTGLLWEPADLTQKALIDHVLDNSGEGEDYAVTLDPGSTFGYSGFGYLLLGRIIEAVSGLPYETYVRDSILGPASTMRIAGNTLADRRPNEVVYYEQSPDTDPYGFKVQRADSSGGWMGSAIDLVRLMTSVDGVGTDEILTNEMRQVMISPPDRIPDLWGRYGKGWFLEDFSDADLPETYWHGGALSGTHSVMARTLGADGSVYCWGAIINTRHDPAAPDEDPPPRTRLRPPPERYDSSDLDNPMRDWFDLIRAWPCLDLF